MQSADCFGPLKGLCPYKALIGLTQATGLAGGFDCNRKSKQRLDRHNTIVAERCETFRNYCIVGCQDDKCRVEAPDEAAGVGGANPELPQQWPAGTGVVQTRRNQRIHLLPLGTGAVNYCQPSAVLRCAGRDLCGAIGTGENVSQRFRMLRHAAYWQCQSGHLLGMRCRTAENAGGASAPMLNDFTGADQVYIACGYTDLRKGIDGLARLVQQQFELDPFTNTLFLFCGRRRDRIKGLYWEKDGFILLYKRLEQGAYQWPRSESEVKTLTQQQQYRWLMEGLQIEQPKAHHPVTGLTAV